MMTTQLTFEEFVAEDMGFSIPRDEFTMEDAFEEVRFWLEEHGYKVEQQRPCSEYDDYISGWINYTKWGFTYLEDEDEWEFEWELLELP